MARVLFDVLRDRSEADRRFVYRALAARLGSGPTNPERVQNALNALRVAMDDLGKPPSRRSYDEWRAGQPDPKSWPSSTAIRNSFGNSWAKAMDALGVSPAPDVLARRLLDRHGYSREEVIQAIQSCIRDTAPRHLPWDDYRAWAGEELKQGTKRRLPLSAAVIRKHFGSWGEALKAAGLDTPYARASSPARRRGPESAYREGAFATCN